MDMPILTMAKHALRLTANAWDVIVKLSRTITRRAEMRPLRAAQPVRSRLAWLTAHDLSPQSVPGLYPGLVLLPRLSMNNRLNTRTRKMLPRILQISPYRPKIGGLAGNRTQVRTVSNASFYVHIPNLSLASVAVRARASDWPVSRLDSSSLAA